MRSLRAQLLWLLSAVALAAALGQGIATFFSTLYETDEIFDYHLRQMALSLRTGRFAPSEVREPRAEEEEADEFEFAVQISQDGAFVFRSHTRLFLPATPPGFSTITAGGGPLRVYTVHRGGNTIQIAQELAARRKLAVTFALRSIWPMLLMAPILLLAVGWSVARTLRPLRRVASALENQAATSFAPIDESDVLPEMQPVVRAMNGLLGRIRHAFDAQQTFVADAAHELRSPLTALKVQIQTLRRVKEETARTLACERLTAGIERSIRLVEQLLTLARQESIDVPAPRGVGVAEAARLALADVAPLAHAREIDIGLIQADDAAVPVSIEALRILIRNLLDNAVRYSPAGSRVDVSVVSRPPHIVLAVADSGAGIPPEEYERVFDRFYRREGASADGSGLGLAIVKAIAQRHGATVALARSPRGGLSVTVTWRGFAA